MHWNIKEFFIQKTMSRGKKELTIVNFKMLQKFITFSKENFSENMRKYIYDQIMFFF